LHLVSPLVPLSEVLDDLKELLIVSAVWILAPEELRQIADLRGSAQADDFSNEGTFYRIAGNPESPTLAIAGIHAPGIKCQRCWCYFDDGGDPELCPRCRAVVRA
jgi:hypothetical protein